MKLLSCTFLLIGYAFVGSGIASAAPSDCPPGWTVIFGSPAKVDKNRDGVYCYKRVNGKGNIEPKLNGTQPAAGFNLKDNRKRR